MNVVKIYEDEDQEVYMLKALADWLSKKKTSQYVYEDEFEDVLNEMLSYIEDPHSKKVYTARGKIPVFSRGGDLLLLFGRMMLFNEAIFLIKDSYTALVGPITESWRDDLCDLIHNYYKLQGLGECYCVFFEEPVHKADGFLYFDYENEDNEIVILPFIINDGKFKRIDE